MSSPQTKTVQQLIAGRETEYGKATQEIFEFCGCKLKQLIPFLINYDREVIWEQIERFGRKSNILYVYAVVKYEKNDIVPTQDGPKCVIGEKFPARVRFLVFADSLQNKEVMDIVKEIKTLQQYEQSLSASESYALFCDPKFYGSLDTDDFQSLYKKVNSEEREEFDFSKLSEEQQSKLLTSDELFLNEKGTLN